MIAAIAANNVIGKANQLPWHLPADMRFFKANTLGKVVIMGRRTFESIGKPLPNRWNVVITSQRDYAPESHPRLTIVHSFDEALEEAFKVGRTVVVVGGSRVYEEALAKDVIHRFYLTRVEAELEGDSYFPPFDQTLWKEVLLDNQPKDEFHPYSMAFYRYDRTKYIEKNKGGS